jgi:hypothetical protein
MAAKKIQPTNPTVPAVDAKKADEGAKATDRKTAGVKFGRKTNGTSCRF